jgi:hypothetical protein
MSRVSFFLFLVLALTACASQSAPEAASGSEKSNLPDLGPAPELTNDTWLNVDAPLRLADLRGKVVLLDMWTFG